MVVVVSWEEPGIEVDELLTLVIAPRFHIKCLICNISSDYKSAILESHLRIPHLNPMAKKHERPLRRIQAVPCVDPRQVRIVLQFPIKRSFKPILEFLIDLLCKHAQDR